MPRGGTYSQTYPQGLAAPGNGRFSLLKTLRVALDVPLEENFDFLALDGVETPPGSLVVVPFGRSRKVGVVISEGTGSAIPLERLRAIEARVEDVPPLGAADLELFEFCAAYYQRPLGEVIAACLPPRLRQPSRRRIAAPTAGRGADAARLQQRP